MESSQQFDLFRPARRSGKASLAIYGLIKRTIAASHAGLTADETAERINLDRLAVRPRVTELAQTGELVDTGKTRPNPTSGKPATVWIDKERHREDRKDHA